MYNITDVSALIEFLLCETSLNFITNRNSYKSCCSPCPSCPISCTKRTGCACKNSRNTLPLGTFLYHVIPCHLNSLVLIISLLSNACLTCRSSANGSNGAAGLAAPVPKPRKPPLGQVFGRPLVGMPCFKQKGQIPKVMDKLADYLAQQRCSRTEGIFRVPAQADMLQTYTAMIDKGGLPDFLTNGDPPVVLAAVCAIGRL